jgi:hypothetical protein
MGKVSYFSTTKEFEGKLTFVSSFELREKVGFFFMLEKQDRGAIK